MLADHVIARHYPLAAEAEHPVLALLASVIKRQAELIARWQLVGFIHGVMNTDNMSIAGETIDYGPCAFMDSYHPDTVYSSIDQWGRYAFAQQPSIAHWKSAVGLANALLPLIADEQEAAVALATEVIRTFPDSIRAFLSSRLAAQARAGRDSGGRRGTRRRSAEQDGGERRRLHADLPQAGSHLPSTRARSRRRLGKRPLR